MGLTISELAKLAGLSSETISDWEADDVSPQAATVEAVMAVLRARGVELIGDRGVALQEQVINLSGESVFFRLLDDVIATLRGVDGAEALFACVCDRMSPPAVIENYRRLRREGIAMRSLVRDGDTWLMGNPKEYRYLADEFFHNNATVIYGNKFATMILDPDTGKDSGAVIIRNAHVAAAQRNLFNCLWSIGRAPRISEAEVRYDE
jgi:transcriptional regulator with XRE-family HTH domain